MSVLPCFLCGKELHQRVDKNRKPYFVCDPCGTQMFIRRKQGIENLVELIKTLQKRDFPFRAHSRTLFEIQAILGEIRGVKEEINKIEKEMHFFTSKKDEKLRSRTLKSLNHRIDTLLSQLEQIARGMRAA
jgi:hypothetical protein